MKKTRIISLLLAVIFACATLLPINAQSETATVESVTAQLEAIDSLQQMQDNRKNFTTSGSYDITTTNQDVIDRHTAVQSDYEAYVTNMNAARLAAQLAYDSLTAEEQAQIDPALVAKLTDTLSTVFNYDPIAVTPRNDEYIYEAVDGGLGYAYEVGNQMVGKTIPQTFVVVDTSNGETSFTPSGPYEYGKSNYEVTYCCDFDVMLDWGTDYKRVNLEDSTYFDKDSAEHIRAIVLNSYPYVTIEEMKARLIEGGLNEDFVNSLNRADIISAVQMAIWRYSRPDLITEELSGYYATVSVTPNIGIYFTPMHDYSNEMWDWLPAKRQRTYNAETAYRVNNLIYYLCNLEGVPADLNTTVISDIKVGRVDLVSQAENLYSVGLHIILNNGSTANDNITLSLTSYSEDENGNITRTSSKSIKVGESNEYTLTINARYGDTIEVVADGYQYVERGVYLYESEFGNDESQAMVGMAEGYTPVHTSESFGFERDIESGLRIYKKSSVDKTPISDITFNVYSVKPDEGEILNENPTEEEIAKYATAENLVGTMVTDVTGYAALALPDIGTYLVIEEHNAEKVKSPADPFYITIPWAVETEVEGENGTETVIEYLDVVSVYPKNTPQTPPPPPPPPPPDDVYGSFAIIKHDADNAEKLLSGAEFAIYRAATDEDAAEDIIVIKVDGIDVAVVPLVIDGEALVLTTNDQGYAESPDLDCGVYYIKETKAPNGYVLPDNASSVTVVASAQQEIVYKYLSNERGFLLPETGGMGITLLILVGSVFAVSSAVLLVTKKRVGKK